MRKFLYITPYFPPQTQVGALRPLKFVRHLAAFGWQAVVLCDLWPKDAIDSALEAEVPAGTVVVRDFSHRATPTYQRNQVARHVDAPAKLQIAWEKHVPAWLANPELLPLSEHGPDMLHALRAARRILAEHRDVEAIVVNADPYAAMLVGAQLHRETGLPLVHDLRDPWAPCQLRRPRRPRPLRWLEDRLERFAIDHAARVILNTRNTLHDYRQFYADLPPERFTVIRNHVEPALTAHGAHAGFDRFTLLYLGRFDRFLRPGTLLRALAELAQRGVGPEALQVVVTGAFDAQARMEAAELGVTSYVQLQPHVPYREIGAIMDAADLLVAMVMPGVTQRVNAKFYDYIGARRPILAITDNPEMFEMLEQSGAGTARLHADVAGIADTVQHEMALGRQRVVPRQPTGLTSREASAQLAELLNGVTRRGRHA